MTATKMQNLHAAHRHAQASVALWQALRAELAAHTAWTVAVEQHGAGAPQVQDAQAAFDAMRAERLMRSAEVGMAAEVLSASMTAVHEEARQ
ncbi:hypothetical protein ACLEPN_30530 [Myxococcus sp. 1LA]